MVVLGYQHTCFVTKDTKEEIRGCNLWVGDSIQKNGDGHKVERIFVTERRMIEDDFKPMVGDEVEIDYNRYGKVSRIRYC